MSDTPPTIPAPPVERPNRGGLILAFGILGLVLCLIFGIIAWVLANGDLRDMDAGRMDPSGRGLTQAGKILGIVSVILWGLGIAFYIVFFVMFGVAVAAGAAGAGGP